MNAINLKFKTMKIKKNEVYKVSYLTNAGVQGSQTMTGAELLKMESDQAKGLYNILHLLNWKSYEITLI